MEGKQPESNGQGLGNGKGKGAGGATGALPGQGVEHRSEQGAAHAQNTLKNPHYTGEFPGRGLEHRSATAGQHAQNTVKNKNLQGEAQDVVVQLGKNGEHLYFHHSDHLGSVSTVTNAEGKPVEHLEYFPFGETWLDQNHNVDKTSYRFTGKEYDQETGLYYFGARYYEPRLSIWVSPDKYLEKYLPTGDKEKGKRLPGMGGVYRPGNISLYTYAGSNPVKFTDPDGNFIWFVAPAVVVAYMLYEPDVANAPGPESEIQHSPTALERGMDFAELATIPVGGEVTAGKQLGRLAAHLAANEVKKDIRSAFKGMLNNATRSEKQTTKTHGPQYERKGGREQAEKDFAAMPGEVDRQPNGAIVKTDKDGNVATMYRSSETGETSIEVRLKNPETGKSEATAVFRFGDTKPK
ncbi:MAG: RHS repeat-associated core domain-containing protein [Deltaproteobacteria bacterium]|nr:RHS repeat-associated core domain-containing protein [Deltaproteobacteria bacterium]